MVFNRHTPETPSEIKTERYFLDESQNINLNGILSSKTLLNKEANVKDGIDFLKQVYTGNTGYEFTHIEVIVNFVLNTFTYVYIFLLLLNSKVISSHFNPE